VIDRDELHLVRVHGDELGDPVTVEISRRQLGWP
jgi:hypothetical protein